MTSSQVERILDSIKELGSSGFGELEEELELHLSWVRSTTVRTRKAVREDPLALGLVSAPTERAKKTIARTRRKNAPRKQRQPKRNSSETIQRLSAEPDELLEESKIISSEPQVSEKTIEKSVICLSSPAPPPKTRGRRGRVGTATLQTTVDEVMPSEVEGTGDRVEGNAESPAELIILEETVVDTSLNKHPNEPQDLENGAQSDQNVEEETEVVKAAPTPNAQPSASVVSERFTLPIMADESLTDDDEATEKGNKSSREASVEVSDDEFVLPSMSSPGERNDPMEHRANAATAQPVTVNASRDERSIVIPAMASDDSSDESSEAPESPQIIMDRDSSPSYAPSPDDDEEEEQGGGESDRESKDGPASDDENVAEEDASSPIGAAEAEQSSRKRSSDALNEPIEEPEAATTVEKPENETGDGILSHQFPDRFEVDANGGISAQALGTLAGMFSSARPNAASAPVRKFKLAKITSNIYAERRKAIQQENKPQEQQQNQTPEKHKKGADESDHAVDASRPVESPAHVSSSEHLQATAMETDFSNSPPQEAETAQEEDKMVAKQSMDSPQSEEKEMKSCIEIGSPEQELAAKDSPNGDDEGTDASPTAGSEHLKETEEKSRESSTSRTSRLRDAHDGENTAETLLPETPEEAASPTFTTASISFEKHPATPTRVLDFEVDGVKAESERASAIAEPVEEKMDQQSPSSSHLPPAEDEEHAEEIAEPAQDPEVPRTPRENEYDLGGEEEIAEEEEEAEAEEAEEAEEEAEEEGEEEEEEEEAEEGAEEEVAQATPLAGRKKVEEEEGAADRGEEDEGDSIAESVQKQADVPAPSEPEPPSRLVNLVTSMTSFLPSLSGNGDGKNKEDAKDPEQEKLEAAEQKRKELEKREHELAEKRRAAAIAKQREIEQKQKRAEAKRRQLAEQEQRREGERRRKEEERLRRLKEQELARKKQKEDEEHRREEKRRRFEEHKRRLAQKEEARRRELETRLALNKTEGMHLGTPQHGSARDNALMPPPKGVPSRHTPQAKKPPSEEEMTSYQMTSEKNENDDESTDEESNMKHNKKIPLWARQPHLNRALEEQAKALKDPDTIFPRTTATCDLEEVFAEEKKKKKRYRTRGSSSNWVKDRLTWKEEMEYKKAIGLM